MATNRVVDSDTLRKGFQYFNDGMLYAFIGFDKSQEEIKTKIKGVEKYDLLAMFAECNADKTTTGVIVKVCHGTFLKTVTTLRNENGVAKAQLRNVPVYKGTMVNSYKEMWQKSATYAEWGEGVQQLFDGKFFTVKTQNHDDRIKTFDFTTNQWVKSYDDSKDGWTSYELDWYEDTNPAKPSKSKK
jgi:hypothetical protein